MKKTALFFVLVSIMVFGMISSPVSNALTTTHFGDGFDYYNTGAWEKSNGWSNGGMFNCGWLADHVTHSGGIMTLRLDNYSSAGKPYSSGEIRTRDTYSYGLYQVRMKAVKNIGVVTSFFTYQGSPWDEIDVEILGKDTTKMQVNYFTNGQGGHEKLISLGFDASTGFHTYGFDWQSNSITWYVDGRQVYRATSNIPRNPGKIYMNLWPGTGVDSWLGRYDGKTPLYAQYDWVAYK